MSTNSCLGRCSLSPFAIVACVAIVASVTLVSPDAFAQSDPGEAIVLSPSQTELNEQAVQAIIDEDYQAAERALRSALTLGEANVLYLNLGRALHRLGKCEAALEAYESVTSAPAVEAPSPDEVAAVLERYRGEVDPTACPAIVKISCAHEATRISIDGADPESCPTSAVQLEPGEHEVVGTLGEQTQAETLELDGMETATLSIDLMPVDTEPVGPVTPAADAGTSTLDILGWTSVGFGGAMLASALIVEVTYLADLVDRSEAGTLEQGDLETGEAIQTLNLALYITGGVLVTGGIVLLLIPEDTQEADDDGHSHDVSAWIAPSAGGVTWQFRF